MALPEIIEIVPLDQPVHAEITVPGSKSITNRALICAALAEGARYVAADTELVPQRFARLEGMPALGVIGTGKRVGKTAVSAWLARRLDNAQDSGFLLRR